MGFANTPIFNDDICKSPTYAGCLYCPRCEAHYTPNKEWGYATYEGTQSYPKYWSSIGNLGQKCPICRREPKKKIVL